MKIAVDGFGGDNAPLSVLQGCELAVREYGAEILLTGEEATLRRVAQENNVSLNGIEIVPANGIIEVEEDPKLVLREKNDCSMGVAFRLLAEGKADAFVSGGSTAAIVVGASFLIKRIRGIKRAALAPIMPSEKGCYMLLDAGANLDCRPEMLLQFGIMASVYMEKVMGVKNPRVGLANIGAEETKGTQLQIDAYNLLKKAPVNFIGNVEPRDIPLDACDVAVADGFTGNVILKTVEGMGRFIGHKLKGIFYTGALSKVAALLVLGKIKSLQKQMDYSEYGGSPLMGVRKPVIKAHGSSDAMAIKNAVRQALKFAQDGVIPEIERALEQYESK